MGGKIKNSPLNRSSEKKKLCQTKLYEIENDTASSQSSEDEVDPAVQQNVEEMDDPNTDNKVTHKGHQTKTQTPERRKRHSVESHDLKELHGGCSDYVNKYSTTTNASFSKDTKKTLELWKISAVLAFVIVITLAIVITSSNYFNESSNITGVRTLNEAYKEIRKKLKVLRTETNQDLALWKHVYSALDTLSEAAPQKPAVLLVAVAVEARATASCLARHLAHVVVEAFQDEHDPLLHDTLTHLSQSWMDHKLTLDDQLKKLNNSHAITIHNLEKMPANTVTLLHGYCDNDNAPYKRVLFLLELEMDTPYEELASAHVEKAVEQRLTNLWENDLPADDIPALVARIAGQVVLVKPEVEKLPWEEELCSKEWW